MSANSDHPGPVESSEDVYRRVLKIYYDPSLEVAVSILAFKPSSASANGVSADDNGISVVRVKFTESTKDALAGVAGDKIHTYYITTLPVALFNGIDLTVVEAYRLYCIGHACVKELNYTACSDKTKKAALKEKMLILARSASSSMILSPVG